MRQALAVGGYTLIETIVAVLLFTLGGLALAKDSEQDDLSTITLSYTMYPVRQPEPSRSRKRFL